MTSRSRIETTDTKSIASPPIRSYCLIGILLGLLSACAAQKPASLPAAAPGSATPAPTPGEGGGRSVSTEGQPPGEASTCDKRRLFAVGDIEAWEIPGKHAFFFASGMTIDADGAPDAYHPNDIGTDFLANAGHPGNWWALVTDNGRSSGTPVVQQASDPNPGFYVSMTALEDRTKATRDPARYVDSSRIPYFVLPSNQRGGAQLGDFGVAINRRTGASVFAIFADIGPRDHLGEGSIALAEQLGIPSNPRRGGTSSDVVYIVFPGSGNGKPRSLDGIAREGASLFDAWGGVAQLDACLP